jgi:hypothetical protein
MSAGATSHTATVEAACRALESATDGATRAAADAYLQSFRLTPRPYAVCIALLQQSALPNAQFISLSTVKAALAREARLLGGAHLTALKDQLLQCIQHRAHTWVSAKRKRVCAGRSMTYEDVCNRVRMR